MRCCMIVIMRSVWHWRHWCWGHHCDQWSVLTRESVDEPRECAEYPLMRSDLLLLSSSAGLVTVWTRVERTRGAGDTCILHHHWSLLSQSSVIVECRLQSQEQSTLDWQYLLRSHRLQPPAEPGRSRVRAGTPVLWHMPGWAGGDRRSE